MGFFNYHTHTTYCDGKSTPEEIVLEAIRLGMDTIGFWVTHPAPARRITPCVIWRATMSAWSA